MEKLRLCSLIRVSDQLESTEGGNQPLRAPPPSAESAKGGGGGQVNQQMVNHLRGGWGSVPSGVEGWLGPLLFPAASQMGMVAHICRAAPGAGVSGEPVRIPARGGAGSHQVPPCCQSNGD